MLQCATFNQVVKAVDENTVCVTYFDSYKFHHAIGCRDLTQKEEFTMDDHEAADEIMQMWHNRYRGASSCGGHGNNHGGCMDHR